MIEVTVLSDPPPVTDEAEFLRRRLGDHHAAQPWVARNGFYRVLDAPPLGPDRSAGDRVPYRFITTAYRSDEESFRAAWQGPAEPARPLPTVARAG